jgi:ABC-2 family transporter protein
MSVLLSSHVLAELERVADYLILLSRGRVQVAGEVDDLLASHRVLTGPAGEADRYAERPVVHAAGPTPRPTCWSGPPRPTRSRRAGSRTRSAWRNSRWPTCASPAPAPCPARPGSQPGPATRDWPPGGGDEMTALTMPGRPARDARLRPVPWRRMAWVTWRQHRAALGGVAAFLGAFAVYLWLTGLPMHHAETAYCHPAGSPGCAINFTGRYGETAIIVSIALQAAPALIGAFAGAPVLARELETGTFRYAWTQGIGRLRWTAGTLVPLAVAVTAVAGAFTVLIAWYNQPWAAAGYVTPFSARVFDLLGVAFAAWTLAAFAIGVLAGMLSRRAVPAIAASLAAYAGLACATALWLREHYITPLVTHNTNPPGSAWIISHWYTGRSGKPLSQAAISQILQADHDATSKIGPNTAQAFLNAVGYLTQHGYTFRVSYQPGRRFWPFQLIEGGWLLALSVLLIAATVWLVRRRAA